MKLLKIVGELIREFAASHPKALGSILQREGRSIRRAARKDAYRKRVKGLFPERRRSVLGPTHYAPFCGCLAASLDHSPEICIARRRAQRVAGW